MLPTSGHVKKRLDNKEETTYRKHKERNARRNIKE
jgi:hypothetical protein